MNTTDWNICRPAAEDLEGLINVGITEADIRDGTYICNTKSYPGGFSYVIKTEYTEEQREKMEKDHK